MADGEGKVEMTAHRQVSLESISCTRHRLNHQAHVDSPEWRADYLAPMLEVEDEDQRRLYASRQMLMAISPYGHNKFTYGGNLLHLRNECQTIGHYSTGDLTRVMKTTPYRLGVDAKLLPTKSSVLPPVNFSL